MKDFRHSGWNKKRVQVAPKAARPDKQRYQIEGLYMAHKIVLPESTYAANLIMRKIEELEKIEASE